jgi:hypothetical protein
VYGRVLDRRFGDLVHDAQRERLLRFDGPARADKVKRCRDAGESWEALRASGTWNNPKLDFGQSKLRTRSHNAMVAGEGDLQSATEGGAIDGRDNRLRKSLNAIEK